MKDDSYIWESLFSARILERGFDYYCCDQVAEISRKDDVITAGVMGTQLYKVTIRLQDERPLNMTCSCPYAAGGTRCKHMAAVLYQWEDEYTKAESAKKFLPGDSIAAAAGDEDPAEMVAKTDESLIRDFLTMVLSENESYRRRFRLLTGTGLSAEEVYRYKQHIDRIVQSYMDRSGFISYDRAADFEIELDSFLDEEIMTMITGGYLKEAFELVMYIFRMLPDLAIDDSDGELSVLADSCVSCWSEIAEAADEDMQTAMFDECTDMLREGELDFFEEYVEEFLMQSFHTPQLLKRKLEYTARMCELPEKSQKPGISNQSAEIWVSRYLDLLTQTNAPEEEIDEFCREFYLTETVRQYTVDRHLSRGDYAGAETVLLESMNMFGPGMYSCRPYDLQLLDLYLKSGQGMKYKALLKSVLLSHRAGNMEMYRTLKEQYEPEEWGKIRDELLKAPAWKFYREWIYEQEDMKEKLLEILYKSGSLSSAERYTELLKEDYSKELLDVYERELRKAAQRAAGRNAYREWARILKKMKRIPGGEECVCRILHDFSVLYPNRRAMMEELKRV